MAFFAQKTVTGTVMDNTKFPLPGASVIIKGTTKGAVTNIDGEFSINIDETPVILSNTEIIISESTNFWSKIFNFMILVLNILVF